MRNNNVKKLEKNRAFLFVAVLVVAAFLAVVVIASVHASYERRSNAEIIDFGKVNAIGEDAYVLRYEEGVRSVDFLKEVKVNPGATLDIVKIKDEDGTVVKGSGTTVDVSKKPLRTAVLRVSSENGRRSTDYSVTVAPKETENNVINYVSAGEISDPAYTYTGSLSLSLPTPKKTYVSPATGNEVEFPFEGWYTDRDFAEESRVESIPEGTSGEVTLYAKFADSVIYGARDGYTYVYYGTMPQTLVTDFSLSRALRTSHPDTGKFTYGGQEYYCYRPSNVPNLSENGYSSSSVYYFYVEPIEWRVLKPKDSVPSANEQVTLLATCVLGGGKYCENGGLVQDAYDKYMSQNNFNPESFENYFYDGNTMYHGGEASMMKFTGIRDTVLSLYNNYMSFSDASIIRSSPSFTYYTNIFGGTSSFSDNVWLIDHDEALNTAYGFSADFTYNDPLRKAYCTDFAAAQGVFRSKERGTYYQGSWWLRGGSKVKTVSYVKYTGYVQRYTASNYGVLSGIRPAMNVVYNTSVLTVSNRS